MFAMLQLCQTRVLSNERSTVLKRHCKSAFKVSAAAAFGSAREGKELLLFLCFLLQSCCPSPIDRVFIICNYSTMSGHRLFRCQHLCRNLSNEPKEVPACRFGARIYARSAADFSPCACCIPERFPNGYCCGPIGRPQCVSRASCANQRRDGD